MKRDDFSVLTVEIIVRKGGQTQQAAEQLKQTASNCSLYCLRNFDRPLRDVEWMEVQQNVPEDILKS